MGLNPHILTLFPVPTLPFFKYSIALLCPALSITGSSCADMCLLVLPGAPPGHSSSLWLPESALHDTPDFLIHYMLDVHSYILTQEEKKDILHRNLQIHKFTINNHVHASSDAPSSYSSISWAPWVCCHHAMVGDRAARGTNCYLQVSPQLSTLLFPPSETPT